QAGQPDSWTQITLSHPDGDDFAAIERHPVVEGQLGLAVLMEQIEDVLHYQPESAAKWLHDYLSRVKVIYSFQLLWAIDRGDGWDAVHALQARIWEACGGILQADLEGYTNEEGYHILWQFSERVAGTWNVAVLDENNQWVPFQMDLGNPQHR